MEKRGIEINWKTKGTKSSLNGFKVIAGIFFIKNSEPSHLSFPTDLTCLLTSLSPGDTLNRKLFLHAISRIVNNDGNDLFSHSGFCVRFNVRRALIEIATNAKLPCFA